jgi:hypothetical protein
LSENPSRSEIRSELRTVDRFSGQVVRVFGRRSSRALLLLNVRENGAVGPFSTLRLLRENALVRNVLLRG